MYKDTDTFWDRVIINCDRCWLDVENCSCWYSTFMIHSGEYLFDCIKGHRPRVVSRV